MFTASGPPVLLTNQQGQRMHLSSNLEKSVAVLRGWMVNPCMRRKPLVLSLPVPGCQKLQGSISQLQTSSLQKMPVGFCRNPMSSAVTGLFLCSSCSFSWYCASRHLAALDQVLLSNSLVRWDSWLSLCFLPIFELLIQRNILHKLLPQQGGVFKLAAIIRHGLANKKLFVMQLWVAICLAQLEVLVLVECHARLPHFNTSIAALWVAQYEISTASTSHWLARTKIYRYQFFSKVQAASFKKKIGKGTYKVVYNKLHTITHIKNVDLTRNGGWRRQVLPDAWWNCPAGVSGPSG